jgi:hypothetical protein
MVLGIILLPPSHEYCLRFVKIRIASRYIQILTNLRQFSWDGGNIMIELVTITTPRELCYQCSNPHVFVVCSMWQSMVCYPCRCLVQRSLCSALAMVKERKRKKKLWWRHIIQLQVSRVVEGDAPVNYQQFSTAGWASTRTQPNSTARYGRKTREEGLVYWRKPPAATLSCARSLGSRRHFIILSGVSFCH